MNYIAEYHEQYWFNDPPQDWDVSPRIFKAMLWIQQMGLTGKWIYVNELRYLMMRFNPTKSEVWLEDV